jgi:hypothetical protein
MIPDRQLSSKKFSVEGVLCSSRRRQRRKELNLRHTSASFEVLIENMASLGIFAVLLNYNARTTHNLASIPITVNLAKARPFAQHLRIPDLDERDGMRCAKRFNKLDILCFRAGLHEHAKVGLTPVQCLCALTQAAGQPVMFERLLQNLLIITIKLRRIYRVKNSVDHLEGLFD